MNLFGLKNQTRVCRSVCTYVQTKTKYVGRIMYVFVDVLNWTKIYLSLKMNDCVIFSNSIWLAWFVNIQKYFCCLNCFYCMVVGSSNDNHEKNPNASRTIVIYLPIHRANQNGDSFFFFIYFLHRGGWSRIFQNVFSRYSNKSRFFSCDSFSSIYLVGSITFRNNFK